MANDIMLLIISEILIKILKFTFEGRSSFVQLRYCRVAEPQLCIIQYNFSYYR